MSSVVNLIVAACRRERLQDWVQREGETGQAQSSKERKYRGCGFCSARVCAWSSAKVC